MAAAPFVTVPDEFTDVMGGAMSTPVVMDAPDGQGMVMGDLGPPHIALLGWIVLLLGLKWFTESNLLSTDPAEVRVSLLNMFSVSLQVWVTTLGAKVGNAFLIRHGVVIPGLADALGAL